MIFTLLISETKSSPTRVNLLHDASYNSLNNNSKVSEYILRTVCGVEEK